MIISIINKKGGVGKTPLAFSLAKDLEYFLISNDDSVIENIYQGMAKILESKNIKIIDNCVYDFGGFVDSRVLEVIAKSDVVLIPFFNDIDAKKRTITTTKELQKVNKNIIFIITKTEKEEDFLNAKKDIEKFFNYPIFELKNSKIFKNVIETGLSVLEIAGESKFNKFVYKNILKQYTNLFDFITKKT